MIKRCLYFLLILCLFSSAVLAEEVPAEPSPDPTSSPEITAAPSETSAPEITAEPTAAVTATPVPTEAPSPTEEATAAPSDTVSPAPAPSDTPDPQQTGDPEPEETVSPEPADTASPEPEETISPSPTESVSPQPTETPAPEPDETDTPEPTVPVSPTQAPDYVWNLNVEGAILDRDVWQITEQNANFTATWDSHPDADHYRICAESNLLEAPLVFICSDNRWTGSLSDFVNGTYEITFEAYAGDRMLSQMTASLKIDIQESESTPTPLPTEAPDSSPSPDESDEPAVSPEPTSEPQPTAEPQPSESPAESTDVPSGGGHTPSKPSHHSSGGKRPGSGSSGNASSSITAGKALIGTHASGTGDLTPHDAIQLELPADEVSSLFLGDTDQTFSVSQGTFSVASSDHCLFLTTDDDESVFTFSQAALSLLNSSDIEEVCLMIGDQQTVLTTQFEFSGFQYGLYRSKGYVSSDFIFHVQHDQIYVSVDQTLYEMNDEAEFVPSSRLLSALTGGGMP